VQIHDVPELFSKRPLITGLAASIGEVIKVDMNSFGSKGGDFVRVWVWLDVRKRLTRFVSFKPEGEATVIMRVKFEKIPRFCAICGLMGHEQEECGTGEHRQGAVCFGKWRLADTPWNRGSFMEQLITNLLGLGRDVSGHRAEGPGGRGSGRSGHGMAGRGGRDGGRSREVVLAENRERTSSEARLEASPAKDSTKLARNSALGPLML
jgi:hypothetical protein